MKNKKYKEDEKMQKYLHICKFCCTFVGGIFRIPLYALLCTLKRNKKSKNDKISVNH